MAASLSRLLAAALLLALAAPSARAAEPQTPTTSAAQVAIFWGCLCVLDDSGARCRSRKHGNKWRHLSPPDGERFVALEQSPRTVWLVTSSGAVWNAPSLCSYNAADPNTTNAPFPGVTRALRVAADATLACALQEGGALVCWGRADRLVPPADGPSHVRRDPTPLDVGAPVAQVVIDGIACVLTTDGRVLCWGRNECGGLGRGHFQPSRELAPVVGLPRAVALTSFQGTQCAITEQRELWCWGYNGHGLVGPQAQSRCVASPTRVPGLPPVAEVAQGQGVTCARSEAGEVHCFGPLLPQGQGVPFSPQQVATSSRRLVGGKQELCLLGSAHAPDHLACLQHWAGSIKFVAQALRPGAATPHPWAPSGAPAARPRPDPNPPASASWVRLDLGVGGASGGALAPQDAGLAAVERAAMGFERGWKNSRFFASALGLASHGVGERGSARGPATSARLQSLGFGFNLRGDTGGFFRLTGGRLDLTPHRARTHELRFPERLLGGRVRETGGAFLDGAVLEAYRRLWSLNLIAGGLPDLDGLSETRREWLAGATLRHAPREPVLGLTWLTEAAPGLVRHTLGLDFAWTPYGYGGSATADLQLGEDGDLSILAARASAAWAFRTAWRKPLTARYTFWSGDSTPYQGTSTGFVAAHGDVLGTLGHLDVVAARLLRQGGAPGLHMLSADTRFEILYYYGLDLIPIANLYVLPHLDSVVSGELGTRVTFKLSGLHFALTAALHGGTDGLATGWWLEVGSSL